MADKEMQLQDVPCEADGILKGEPSEPGKELIPDNEDGDGQADDDVLKGEPSEPEKDQNLPLQDNQDVDAQANGREKTQVRFLSPDPRDDENPKKRKTWLLSDSEAQGDDDDYDDDEAGTPEEQQAFLIELATFHKENYLDYKPLKFYGQPLNALKLWRAVIKLGGYDVVTTSKLWRQVGESFNPPKTCTTVSYTFRIFYEKALLEYEKSLMKNGDLNLPDSAFNLSSSLQKEVISHQGSGSGRARRDSAARAMQGWHTQRLAGSRESTETSVKDKGSNSTPKHKKLKSIGLPKPRPQTCTDLVVSQEGAEKQSVADVVDDGPIADWVKITVKETKNSFEVFALVPGLLRHEVRIQSDPAGRLIITGEPEQLDNPWGITPFKKIVSLPSRIDPLRTSAVISLHGRVFIRAPFEQ